jgi:indole-3-glycerol phosphate synthase
MKIQVPLHGIGIIAEFKRKSPSKGFINTIADPAEVAGSYFKAGTAAMSILTDRNFFGGSLQDLKRAREAQPGLCILRKDFMIDPFQLYEARAYGADIILLIAAVLSKEEVRDLSQLAAELGLQVLLEVHSVEEMDVFDEGIELIGVNNRNLKDFSVDIHTSLDLIRYFPSGVTAVSESGLKGPKEIRMLHEAGFGLFLMGERFMMGADPGEECRKLMEAL